MPTPSGKLKAGDRLRWEARNPRSLERIGEPAIDFIVVERTGNDLNYSVWLRRADGDPIPDRFSSYTRNNRTEFMLLEAHYQIKHGPFRILAESKFVDALSEADGLRLKLRAFASAHRDLLTLDEGKQLAEAALVLNDLSVRLRS